MGEINKVLGAAGAGLTIRQCEKVWTASPITKRIQAKFEDWLEARARRHVAAFAGVVGDDELGRMAERLGDRIEKGEYSFGGDKCQEAIATPSGSVELFRLMLEPKHPGVTGDDVLSLMVECGAEFKILLKQIAGKTPDDADSKKNAPPEAGPSPTWPAS